MHTPESEFRSESGAGYSVPVDRPAASANGLLDDVGQLGHGVKELFGAQVELASAELGLARSALSWVFMAGLAATVVGVGLGLTLLALIGVLLATWFGSWLAALAVLAVLQVLFLVGAIVFFRRCLHWMSLPVTRAQWGAMMRDTMGRARRQARGSDPT